MEQQDIRFPWVVFRLENDLFSVSARHVRSLVSLDAVAKVPCVPADIRGVMNLRGQVIQLLDLRLRLGMRPVEQAVRDFGDMLDQRRRDHENWLHELRNCTLEQREFKLATDPHQCAFGRWHDAFQARTPDMKKLLKQFDRPHQQIHATAARVMALKAAKKDKEALDLLEAAWQGEFQIMSRLFTALKDEMMQAYRDSWREIALVIEESLGRWALIVDEVIAVEPLESHQLGRDVIPPALAGGIDFAVGKRGCDGSLVLMLTDPVALHNGCAPAAA